MPIRDRAAWALAAALSIALLIAPALWNGFPLLQWDTGGYLARWYEGTLVISRATLYGLLLRAGVPLAFWPVLAVQAALTVWIVALMLRAHGLGRRPWLMLGIVAALTVFTTLPWLTAILLTDIFCGLGVLALYLLLLRADALTRAERIALVILTAAAAATHNATMAVLMALTLAALPLAYIGRRRLPAARIANAVIALLLGAGLVFASNYIVAKRIAWTPGGFALSFGRMLQDGIVKKYLDAHCPDPGLRLCAVKDRIPQDADTWFWGSDLFDSMGRFAGLDKEMKAIALGALVEYPSLQLQTAAVATARQFVNVRTGEGVLDDLWHTQAIIKRFTPELVPVMLAARQQNGGLPFEAINALHYPLALLGMALLPLIVWLAWRGKLPAELGELATIAMLALAANAFVCGALSNPHDRYGARMVWLAGITVALAVAHAVEQRRRAAHAQISAKPLLNETALPG
jgi:hypothetical protein